MAAFVDKVELSLYSEDKFSRPVGPRVSSLPIGILGDTPARPPPSPYSTPLVWIPRISGNELYKKKSMHIRGIWIRIPRII